MEDEEHGSQTKDSYQKRFAIHLQRLFSELPNIKDLNISKMAQGLNSDMVKYCSCSSGTAFYQEGDVPGGCYILLSGKVQHWKKDTQVTVPFAGNSEGGLPASKHCSALTSMLSKRGTQPTTNHGRRGSAARIGVSARRPSVLAASRRSSIGSESCASAAEDVPIQNFGVIVASNGPGSMFGDSELLVDQPRLTTAVSCSETCEFLLIERHDFENVMKREIHNAEIRQVAPHIHQVMTQFPFFRKIDQAVQLSVAEIMHFTYHRRKDVIFRQGDPGDLCYIILSGEVGIWVNGLKDSCSDASVRKEYGTQVARSSCGSILTALTKVHSLSKSAAFLEEELDEDPQRSEVPENAGQVVILGPGKMFGELALLEDQPRSATVVCNEDSAFLTIEKADFERVLKKAMNEAVMSLPLLSEPLLNEIPFFQALRPTVRQRVRHMVKYCVAQRGSVMAWQNDVPNRCYIVLSGELSCWRFATEQRLGSARGNVPEEEEAAHPSEVVYSKCAELASRLSEVGQKETKAEDSKISDEVYEHTGTRRRMVRRESMVDVLGDHETTLSQGSVFGDHELLVDQRCSMTVVCDKDCQFLYIDRTDFDRVVKEDLMRQKVQELNMQVRRLLHGFPLFNNLSPSIQDTVPAIVHYCSHSRGTVLFKEGDEPDMCYIILAGEVTIFKKKSTAVAIGEADKTTAGTPYTAPQFPPVSQAHPETYERCVQLAQKLAPVSSCLRRKTVCETALMDLTKNGEVPVASLGPGFLFGDMGLLNNNTRNATVYCRKECEFLAIENCDFDRVLKREMARIKDEKLEFLRTYVPGMKALPERMAEGLLHHFDKKTVPLNHVFIREGEVADGSIYFVWQGSVEFFTNTGKQSEGFSLRADSTFRRLRVLIKGGVFGAVPVDMRVPFTAVARSAPCEVLHITMQHLKQLPEPVMRGLRKLMDQTLVWASENCAPILTASRENERRSSIREGPSSPTGAASRLASASRGNPSSLPSLSRVSRLQSSKIPRPLSLKIPRPLDTKQGLSGLAHTRQASSPSLATSSVSGSPSSGSQTRKMPQDASKTWGGGLFQRTSAEATASDAFGMNPGEAFALKAKLPSRRKISLHMGPSLGKSLSLPQMRRAPDSSPSRGCPNVSQELR